MCFDFIRLRKGRYGINKYTLGMNLFRGEVLTSRKSHYEFLSLAQGREMEWFLHMGMKENNSYGKYKGIYVVEETLNLLNMGSKRDRDLIQISTGLEPYEMTTDFQYSCDDSNVMVHNAILGTKVLEGYDGTIASRLHTDKELDENMHGIEEVVLFLDRVGRKLTLIKVVEDEVS